ncbi:HugZ family pyridoxamine 5'-phosphate oxidase [Shinella pollutisoli]|uniref:HugZ family protein n=1 Tax=Shinella pollutisoli TaxID=2250594 RepID=A0ABV7DLH0_9HYPH|nr:HugZ family protein [Shinella pollutisoli]
MAQEDKPSVLRETDDDARRLARTLLRSARSCALAVIEPETGFPFASRTLTGTDTDGVSVILVSALSAHTTALRADPRASLLAGEPGKGDPLAHPRLTVIARAEAVARDAPAHAALRERFVRRHPKAKLYVDFPDFAFFRLVPERAFLNGGFGKAFLLTADDLTIRSPARAALAEMETGAVDHMNSDHAEAAGIYARHYCGARDGDWTIVGLDAAGIDLASGDRLKRLEFERELREASELREELARLLRKARGQN